MIISQIVGGLGNQLFEFAAARKLSLLLNQEIKLDLSFFDRYHKPDVFRLDKFNVIYDVAKPEEIQELKRRNSPVLLNKIWKKIFKQPLYFNSKYHFDPKWFKKNDISKLRSVKNIYLSGYFADPLFFYETEDVILKEFTLKEDLNDENKKMKEKINQVNSVSLHLRRGDYVNNFLFTNLPLSYYERGVSFIKERVKNPIFFIFSDDLQWVKDNLNFNADVVFVDINNDKTDYMELMLMASCIHNIIANSTFSWWGARLNQNIEKIVLTPRVWYNSPEAQAKYLKSKEYQEGWYRI